ncbi:hypothetical protein J6590_025705 [Homalodisca vitripennis]|nr:hypothetical protein J6590_025705 [Homalodisca vitripennis]
MEQWTLFQGVVWMTQDKELLIGARRNPYPTFFTIRQISPPEVTESQRLANYHGYGYSRCWLAGSREGVARQRHRRCTAYNILSRTIQHPSPGPLHTHGLAPSQLRDPSRCSSPGFIAHDHY